jgi:hypothetical protein
MAEPVDPSDGIPLQAMIFIMEDQKSEAFRAKMKEFRESGRGKGPVNRRLWVTLAEGLAADWRHQSQAHQTASSLRVKEDLKRLIGRNKGGTNTTLHAVNNANGRPLRFLMTAG